MRTNKVLLIYTGGTIGMGKNAQTGALEPLDFRHLVENVPEFDLLQTDVGIYQFDPPIDSSDMDPTMWAKLVNIISENYNKHDGFVILQCISQRYNMLTLPILANLIFSLVVRTTPINFRTI